MGFAEFCFRLDHKGGKNVYYDKHRAIFCLEALSHYLVRYPEV